MDEIIDFTKMRLNTNTRGYLRVTVCEKCGRKGEHMAHENKRNGTVIHEWTHTAKSNGIFTTPIDVCRVVKPAEGAQG
jgi:hypothetical protein